MTDGPDGRERTPVRTCIGCRKQADPRDLVRLYRDPADHSVILPDPGRTAPGRGAYVHPDRVCLDAAISRRGFNRAFRTAPGPGGWQAAAVQAYVDQLSASGRPAGGPNRHEGGSSPMTAR